MRGGGRLYLDADGKDLNSWYGLAVCGKERTYSVLLGGPTAEEAVSARTNGRNADATAGRNPVGRAAG